MIHIGEEALTAILMQHQRAGIDACACGWSKLGHSHARHVVEQVKAAQQQ